MIDTNCCNEGMHKRPTRYGDERELFQKSSRQARNPILFSSQKLYPSTRTLFILMRAGNREELAEEYMKRTEKALISFDIFPVEQVDWQRFFSF